MLPEEKTNETPEVEETEQETTPPGTEDETPSENQVDGESEETDEKEAEEKPKVKTFTEEDVTRRVSKVQAAKDAEIAKLNASLKEREADAAEAKEIKAFLQGQAAKKEAWLERGDATEEEIDKFQATERAHFAWFKGMQKAEQGFNTEKESVRKDKIDLLKFQGVLEHVLTDEQRTAIADALDEVEEILDGAEDTKEIEIRLLKHVKRAAGKKKPVGEIDSGVKSGGTTKDTSKMSGKDLIRAGLTKK